MTPFSSVANELLAVVQSEKSIQTILLPGQVDHVLFVRSRAQKTMVEIATIVATPYPISKLPVAAKRNRT